MLLELDAIRKRSGQETVQLELPSRPGQARLSSASLALPVREGILVLIGFREGTAEDAAFAAFASGYNDEGANVKTADHWTSFGSHKHRQRKLSCIGMERVTGTRESPRLIGGQASGRVPEGRRKQWIVWRFCD